MKQAFLKVIKSNQFKTFCWQTAVGVLSLTAAYITELNPVNAAILVAFCNFVSKEINKKYLQK